MRDDATAVTRASAPPWEAELPAAQRGELLERIVALHPDRDPRELTGMMRWDLVEYERPHLPVLIGVVQDRAGFSAQRGLRILDMAIRMPHQGWAVPDEYMWFREVIALAVAHERAINPDFEHYYVYLTVDQKIVGPRESQRRPGWHGDAFVSSQTNQLVDEHGRPRAVIVDNTYVVSDTLPTRFLPGPFSLRGVDAEDIPAVLARFEALAAGKEPITFPPYSLVRMTPYDVHAVSVNETDQPIQRTFVKLQFSRDKLNMRGNTLNPRFSYDDWSWVPRLPAQRNNRNTISGWDRPDADQFRLVDPGEIDFSAQVPGLPWLEPGFVYAMKTQGVWAEPAQAGQMLEAVVHGAPVTFNIAQAGDWRIMTSQGDSYFLGPEKFARRYQPRPTAEGWYLPIPVTTKMAIAREQIRFRAPWGAWQYVPAGSAVVRLDGDDVYAIHRANFEASYTRVRAPGRTRPPPPPLQPHQDFIDAVVERDGDNGFAFFGASPPPAGRLGVFTITANPLHLGHVAVATQVSRKAGLDGVVIVLAKQHVTKGGHLEATVAERLAMLEAAFAPAAGFYLAVSARGFYRDFVASLAALAPGAERHLIFGIDSLARYIAVTAASEAEALIGGVTRVLVSFRGPAGERRDALIAACREKLSAAAAAKIEAVPVDDSGLSSTAIRALIRRGGSSWLSALPAGVAEIIRRRHIYVSDG